MIGIGSLFSGIGGLDLAVADTFGGTVVWHSEVDRAAATVLSARWPGVPNLGDVTTIDWDALGGVDVLIGGFPCQDVSFAGNRAGLAPSTRTGLWTVMAEAIGRLRPRMVVIENVAGIRSASAAGHMVDCPFCLGDRPGDVLRALGAVLGDLAGLGFDAEWVSVRASDAGAPHRRERVFVLAWDAADTGGRSQSWPAEQGGLPVAAERGPARRQETSGQADGGSAGPVTLLPTPTAQDSRDGQHLRNITVAAAARGSKEGIGLNHLIEGEVPLETARLLPTPATTNSKSTRAMTASTDNGRRSGGGQSSPLGLEETASLLAGEVPEHLPAYENLPPGSREQVDRLLPTPNARDFKDASFPPSLDTHRAGDTDKLVRAIHLLPTPTKALGEGGQTSRSGDRRGERLLGGMTDFGPYQAAIDRWGQVLGRPAPPPTVPGADGRPRLNSAFVEWMMGLPDGWVTGLGLGRTAELRLLGNAVVPAQCALALQILAARYAV